MGMCFVIGFFDGLINGIDPVKKSGGVLKQIQAVGTGVRNRQPLPRLKVLVEVTFVEPPVGELFALDHS